MPAPARLGVPALLLICATATAAAAAPVLHHDARVVLDAEAHTVAVTDRVVLPEGAGVLRVGEDMTVLSPEVAVTLAGDPDGTTYQELDLAGGGFGPGDEVVFELRGTFHQPTDQVTFSRENVGGEITATVGDEGIYLSAGSGWLPWHPSLLATHRVEVVAPEGFRSVTQGRPEAGPAPHVTTWVAEHPSDGLNLVANRFVVHEEEVHPGVTAMTFFLEDDARLRATYLERTQAYLAMYEEMIGPYPYAKFATVENWFPTGYGMPSWTLLGGQVLRLPFIPTTSFGHEIAHNWWGNSVFVDVAGGNWCEGLTSWCADYHYKELESPAAAREYRRNLLKDYQAYVNDPEQDFPLRDFRSRHSGATRAVGYGKSMMVFHMIDRAIGREAFLTGLRQVFRDFLFAQASWDDFLDAFAASGGIDPDRTAAQWLDRTGAPRLQLADVRFTAAGVAFTLRQESPPYTLRVPVRVDAPGGAVEETVLLDGREQDYELAVAGATRLAVDPDYDIFRHLHPAEVEPTISQVLAETAPMVVVDGPELEEAARAFAVAWTDSNYYALFTGGRPPADLAPGTFGSSLLLNPAAREWLRPEVAVAGRTVVLDGKRYDLDRYDLVYATANPVDPRVTDLVIHTASPERLAGLARRLGHYGKYSWLLLPTGQGRVLRGNWRPLGSPLVAEAP